MARRNAFRMLLVLFAATLVATAASAQATSTLPLADAQEALAALRSGEAEIVELKAPSPDWFTPELARRVAEKGVLQAPVDAPLPGEVGIRPGSWMISPSWCTMNFIFQKSTTLAIGTAGHCVGGGPVVLLTLAPTGGNPVLVQLGKVLLRKNSGIGRDYALVQIPTSRYEWVFPTIAGVGGPCGIYTGTTPQPVAHYGHGIVLGTGGTPRVGQGIVLIRGMEWDADSYAWVGALSPGDSGSAVRIGQLPAVGNLTHGIGVAGLPTPSPIGWGTRVTTITSSGWKVVNSPLCL
jgi:hypothetical protein